ncbi:DUF3332 family protein, partial [Phocaeicola vulgatus]|uniref:DUF3332 family protein n=1 Tax=Phocaeicola vulgatus TaxID=821 RepID=UPI001E2D5CAF
WQNPEQLFVAQELINKVKSKCCGIKGEDKSVDLVYNKENNTWNAVADGQSFELVKMNEDGTAVLSLQNGTSMTVTPDAQGIATARIATGNSLFFAAR